MQFIFLPAFILLITSYSQQNKVNDSISYFNENDAVELVSYSLAASCDSQRIQHWKCGQPCELYPQMTDIKVVENKDLNILSLVGYNSKTNKIILTFKPYDEQQNLEQLLKIQFKQISYNCGDQLQCKVNEGFNKVYNSIKEETQNNLSELIQKYNEIEVFITGYSFGGAIATLAAAEQVQLGFRNFNFYTFGSPRVGNFDFAFWLEQKMQNRYFRVTHSKDPIIHLPTQSQDYHHLPQEIFYSDGSEPGELHYYCNMLGEDPSCSDQYKNPIQWDITDHHHYMGFNSKTIYKRCNNIQKYKQKQIKKQEQIEQIE